MRHDRATTICCTRCATFLQWRCGDAIMLAEANVPPTRASSYFGEQGDRLQMMFNFWVNQRMFYALASGDATAARARRCEQTRDRPADRAVGATSCATTTSSISAA